MKYDSGMEPGWIHRAILAVLTENNPLTITEIVKAINQRPELLPKDFVIGHGSVGAALDKLWHDGQVGCTVATKPVRWHL